MAGFRRRWVGIGLRWTLTAAAVAFVATWMVDWGEAAAIARRTDPRALAWVAALGIPVGTAGLRWWLILRVAGLHPSATGTIGLVWAGSFFSLFLAGGAGGDLVRAWVAARETQRKGAALASILIDRGLGLAVMVAMGLAACVAQWERPEMRRPSLGLALILAGGVAAVVMWCLPPLRQSRPARWVLAWMPWADQVRDADRLIRTMGRRWGTVAAAVALSLVGQVVYIGVLVALARAMRIGTVGAGELFAVAPLVFVVNAIPISVGGLGVGEAAAAALLGPFGVAETEAVALVLAFRLSIAVAAAPGALMFGMGKARPGFRSDSRDEAGAGAGSA